MTDQALEIGVIRTVDGYLEGKIERTLEHSRTEVWHAITSSEMLPKWLAGGSIEQKLGGKVKIDFVDSGIVIDSKVTAFETERVLAYSWSHGTEPERPLQWELTDTKEGTHLTLTVRVPVGEDAAKACAGFEAHLHMLIAVMEGLTIKFPFQLYLQAREAYKKQLAGSISGDA